MPVSKSKTIKPKEPYLKYVGLLLGILYWIFDVFMHVYVFNDGSFSSQFLNPGFEEVVERMSFLILFACSGFLAYGFFLKYKLAQTQFLQTEDRLRRREQLFQTSLRHSSVGVAYLNIKGEMFKVNEALCNTFGYTPEELIGKTYDDLAHPEDRQKAEEDVKRYIRGDVDTLTFERRYLHKHKHYVWTRSTITVVKDTKGDFAYNIAFIEDISGQKAKDSVIEFLIQQTSKTSGLDFFNHLVQNLASVLKVRLAFISEFKPNDPPSAKIIAMWDKASFVDPFEYTLEGTPCENVVGKKLCFYPLNVQQLFPKDRWLVDHRIEGYLATPFFDSKGKPIGHMGIMHSKEITFPGDIVAIVRIFADRAGVELERKMVLDSLEQSEAYIRSIVNATPDLWLVFDEDGTYQEIFSTTDMTPLGPKQNLIGKKVMDVMPKPTADKVLETIKRTLDRNNLEKLDYDLTYQGKTSNFSASVVPLPTRNNKRHVLWVVRDVTKDKQMDEFLRQKDRLETIGTLAGGIAHDFNNLMLSVIGNAELLLPSLKNKEKHHLEIIVSDAERAATLTKKLLDFGKPTPHEPKPIKVHVPITTSIQMLKNIISKKIKIETDFKDKNARILADQSMIEQLFTNLCVNAFQAMKNVGGILTIKTWCDSGANQVVITFSDTGVGMSRDIQAKVFDPFFTTKQVGEGTGLGLSVAYGIAKSHHGTISVESEVGKGTTFTVRMPMLSKEDLRKLK